MFFKNGLFSRLVFQTLSLDFYFLCGDDVLRKNVAALFNSGHSVRTMIRGSFTGDPSFDQELFRENHTD